jgi:8-amino-7-oxononanoate synthase
LRGNHPRHEELEAFAAHFFNVESALYFSSGYDANMALLSTVPTRRDAIVMDERVHASAKEGARASLALIYKARHNDVESYESALRRARQAGARELFIAIESVYSMDGDCAPLAELCDLTRKYEATLIVDEAHATGIYGSSGRGLTEGMDDCSLITLHTCGKALGVSGAFVVGDKTLTQYLINKARPFLYSTAPSPILPPIVMRAMQLIDEEPQRRLSLLSRIHKTREKLKIAVKQWPLGGDRTQILPINIGDEAVTVEAARFFLERGLDVRAIRAPTVPTKQCRLRISLRSEHTDEQIKRLAEVMREAERHAHQ